jgi:catechol 2,3-dioxygenase-like lactoylglutathione lyase family enzyme
MFTQMNHVGLSVKDMEKAIAFYRDIIGMEVSLDTEFDSPLADIIGSPGAKARIVHMRLGESVVELFDYKQPQGREPRADANQSDYGLTHIGFLVKDFQKTYDHLKQKGIQFLGKPVEIRPGVHVAYFQGVEQEVCEMREITG